MGTTLTLVRHFVNRFKGASRNAVSICKYRCCSMSKVWDAQSALKGRVLHQSPFQNLRGLLGSKLGGFLQRSVWFSLFFVANNSGTAVRLRRNQSQDTVILRECKNFSSGVETMGSMAFFDHDYLPIWWWSSRPTWRFQPRKAIWNCIWSWCSSQPQRPNTGFFFFWAPQGAQVYSEGRCIQTADGGHNNGLWSSAL